MTKKHFVKATIDKSNYTNTDDKGHVTIDKSKQSVEIARFEAEMAIEMKWHYQHENIGGTLCNIVWDQSDDGVKVAYKNHNNFEKAFWTSNIIGFLKIVKEIFTNADFGNICDGIYWCLQQYQNLFNYTQTK